MAEDPQPEFNAGQRKALADLGLLADQIDELQMVALPTARALLRKPAALNDVRDCLKIVSESMARATAALTRLLAANNSVPALQEALLRVQLADFNTEHNTNAETIRTALKDVSAARAVIDRARQDLSSEQRRHRAASPLPLYWINKALLRGFLRAYEKTPSLPHYRLTPSASPNSKYRRIIRICYEAMGQKNSDPERAIKALIARRKQAWKRDVRRQRKLTRKRR